MGIGIRKNDMPMKINGLAGGLLIFGLLASSICGYARTPGLGEPSSPAFQDTAQTDTVLSLDSAALPVQRKERSEFNAKQLILPGALIAVGTFGVYNGAFGKLNTKIRNGMNDLRGNHFFRADDYIQYLPAFTYLTFGSIGIKSKHSFKERVVVEATAYIAMAAVTNIAKYSFREKRPDSGARNSFPSGHTATVFTGAELMREEYGLGLGIGAYVVAVGVAGLRIYNGRHWLNDVIAGAGVGILSARIGYWMLPLYRKWFKWDKSSSGMMVISPSYNPDARALSFNLAYTF